MSKVQRPTSKVFVVLLLLLLGQGAWANHTAIEGGVRSGLALGLRSEYDLDKLTSFRFGLAGTTGNDLSFANTNPLVLYAGLDRYFFDLQKMPVELGAGVVVYSSDNSTLGPYLHAIANNLGGRSPLYAEIGIDFVQGARLNFQVGYKLWTIYSPVQNPY